jgi:outer membrane receptor protein involved in Fe transport
MLDPIDRRSHFKVRLAFALVAIAGLLVSPERARAADLDPASDALAEVVVVAQKRPENSQRIPISVESMSSEQLATSGVQTFQNLGAAVPGLTMLNVSGAISPRLRGVGTSTLEAGIEPAVATYVDGVYYAYSGDLTMDLSDIDRVTVLKGPQGTLFGRNATGGVIQIETRDPTRGFSADVSTSIDNYLTSRTDGYVSGGLTEDLSAGVSIQYIAQGLGWGTDLYDDTDTHKIDHAFTLRGKVVYDPNEATTVKLGADYSDRTGSVAANFRPFPGYRVLFPVAQSSDPWDTDSYIHSYKSYRGGGASAVIERDLGFATLASTSAFRDASTFIRFSPAATSVPSEDIHFPESSRQFTEELQLVSNTEGRLDWAAGMFYFASQAAQDAFTVDLHEPLAGPFDQIIIPAREAIDSVAGYSQGTYKITPSSRITVGARYTHQENVLHGSEYGVRAGGGDVPLVPQPNPDSISSEKPTWRLALDHDVSENTLGYVSYNRGGKSGGFNIRDPANPAFLPEQLDAYEVGLKSEASDHRVRIDTAAFDYEYKNIQISRYTDTAIIENGARARIYGIDQDLTANVADAIQLRAGIEWLHARFLDFPDAQFTTPLPGDQGAILRAGDASGKTIPYSPTFTGTLSVDYRLHTSAGNETLSLTDNYNSGFYGEPDNRLFQSSFHLLNASIAHRAANDRWSVRLYADNLLNKAVASQSSSLNVGYVADYSNPPRIYGAAVRVNF